VKSLGRDTKRGLSLLGILSAKIAAQRRRMHHENFAAAKTRQRLVRAHIAVLKARTHPRIP
jgi:hypothetical protein